MVSIVSSTAQFDMNVTDPWRDLRNFTSARIALGRSGGSLPTAAQLDFRLAHARARDAVLAQFHPSMLASRIAALGDHPVMTLDSAAGDRAEYLRRPDLGRRLSSNSRALLIEAASHLPVCDLVIVVSDGLSTHAADSQIEPLLAMLLPSLRKSGWMIAPILVTRHARVALQDEAGEILKARMSLILLGERPGLGSSNSLGAYFTFAPSIGKTDAERNCVSNIRPGGILPTDAALKIHQMLLRAARLQLSGVELKDETMKIDCGSCS